MNWSQRWTPRFLSGIAVVHIVAGLAFWTPFGEIVDAGIVDSIDPYPERQYAFWYFMAGVAWLTLAELARWTVRETGRLPGRLGAWLLGTGVAVSVFMPASGGWVVAALGALELAAARAAERRPDVPSVVSGSS